MSQITSAKSLKQTPLGLKVEIIGKGLGQIRRIIALYGKMAILRHSETMGMTNSETGNDPGEQRTEIDLEAREGGRGSDITTKQLDNSNELLNGKTAEDPHPYGTSPETRGVMEDRQITKQDHKIR